MATSKKKRKVKKWVWVIGWIFCFPIPLTAIIVRSSRINKLVKGTLLTFLWFFSIVWTMAWMTVIFSDEQEGTEPTNSPVISETVIQEEIDYKEKFKDEIGDSGITGPDNVYMDVTGRWRVTHIYTDKDFIPYAADYYHGFFESDDEIHAVINLYQKTTTKISVIGVNLQVVVYEYVDGEEHDAKALFSGSSICGYIINKVTGEYERYETNWDYTVVESDSSIEEAAKILLDNRGYTNYIVNMDGKDLVIEFQQLPAAADGLDSQRIAYLTTVSFTDDFLEQYTNDDEWDVIIVKFVGVGEYRLTKDQIMDSGGYGRFFNFFADDLITY